MSPDFRDLLSEFNARGVEFLVVGAYALAAHGRVRATGDFDVWIRPSQENAPRVLKALTAFGAPLQDLSHRDLAQPGVVFQIGVAPIRIDILTAIDVDGDVGVHQQCFGADLALVETAGNAQVPVAADNIHRVPTVAPAPSAYRGRRCDGEPATLEQDAYLFRASPGGPRGLRRTGFPEYGKRG